MCRFVAYRGPETPIHPLVFGGTHPLVEQSWAPRELLVGHTNADGYGIVWYDGGLPVRIARPEPIWYDPDLGRLLESVRGSTILASLRNATPTMPLGTTGVTPMVAEEWSFVLNGFVQGFHRDFKRRFHDTLPPDLYTRLRSGTDSETLFLMAVKATRDGADAVDALRRVIVEVTETVHAHPDDLSAQLNMALSDGRTLAISRASTKDATNSLYLASDLSLLPGGVVVASEALDEDPAWEAVRPQSIVQVDEDGAVEVEPVFL